MCWKQEWATAIGNLGRAILHIEKAQVKLDGRLLRNEENLQRMKESKKYNFPKMLKPVETLMEKNELAIKECTQLINELKKRQDQLFHMIQVNGIKRSENSQRLYKLMGKYSPGGLKNK